MTVRTRTRVRKRDKLLDLGFIEVHLNWGKLGEAGWRQVVPWPSSLSLRVLWWTWNPQRRTVYSNLPGVVDTVTTYGEPESRQPTALEQIVARRLPCTVPTCQAQPDTDCRTPSGRPASRPHKPRIEAARAEIRRRGDTTPGGRSRRLGPVSPLGQLVRRIIGAVLVVAVAALVVVALGLDSGVDVIRAELGL
jgi:hypothetical protein